MQSIKIMKLHLKYTFSKLAAFVKKLWSVIRNSISFLKNFITFISKGFYYQLYAYFEEAGKETGILAVSLIVNKNLHIIERLVWFFVFLASIVGALFITSFQSERFQNAPSVISFDRDYRGWNGTLPAVTLCYYDHIDSFKANEYIQVTWNTTIIDEGYFYLMDFLTAAVNATAANFVDLTRFAQDERFDNIDLYDLVLSIDRPFDQVISSFDTNFDVQVLPVMTERGPCYAINSPFSEILTGTKVDYHKMIKPLTCEFGKQKCFIKIDLYESTGSIDVHSPYEISTTDASLINLKKSDEISASFKVMETVATPKLRELQTYQRKCVFHDEETSNLKIYSTSLCLAKCRALMALEMCNCIPFFYRFIDGPPCNPAGFECLLDFKWPVWALHICKCPTTCNEVSYSIQTVKKSSWGSKNDDSLRSDTATSSFRWELIPPKIRNRRDVVFSFEDLLVSFGGTLALFLGFSMIAGAQLVYVLFWQVLQLIFKSCSQNYNSFKHFKRTLKKKNSALNLIEVKPQKIHKSTNRKPWFGISLSKDVRKKTNRSLLHDKVKETEVTAKDIDKPRFEFVN